MHFWSLYFGVVFLVFSCVIEGLYVVNDYDPGQCDKSNHAEQVLVLDRENNEKILVCTLNDGVYQWTTAAGENLIGEIFNPGYDCSTILDAVPEAKNGMYWVHLGGNAKQVYCDMVTDGGGYMLIGRKNNSKTWTVPSNDFPVKPLGDPHWASNLGDSPILDFRIQVGLDEDLEKTIAHWALRFQSERPLKRLMIMNTGGCGPVSPGIGNIAYVIDLMTENIVTTSFRCSVFGGYYHPSTKYGWGMMNSCLNKPCHRGFAFLDHPTVEYQLDHSGSFSYSATGNTSGITHDATAFVGCDKGACCGCYGPVGGTADYCGTDCTAKNGGTVVKNVYTWFWVRSSLPKKVWNKCMEYKETMEDGTTVWYRLLDGNPTPEKGRCPQNDASLNEGIVVVPDGDAAQKVPVVPGLLQYRKDNKELFVRSNETWKAIAPEKKIMKVLNNYMSELKSSFKSDVDQLKAGLTNEIIGVKEVVQNVNDSLNKLTSDFRVAFSQSVILSGEPSEYRRMLKAWVMGATITWKICWRATRDGWASSTFHSNCNYKGPSVTIVKVGNYIFGGYTTQSWRDSGGYRLAPGSFMFSLRNKENLPPFKAPLKDQNNWNAIFDHNSYGPTFGSHDLYISSDAASNTNSFTGFNDDYQPPSGVSDTGSILAGTHNFTPSEVEVFYLI